jgi:hypothetical protein
MTISIANVNQSTDSFGQWIEKTNKSLFGLSYKTVTTNSNTTVGNAAITGTFTSNNISVNSSITVGYTTSNVIISNTNMAIRSTATTNTVYTANGMTIDGTVLYTGTLMRLGNTTLRFSNVTSNAGYFNSNVTVGNTIIYPNRIMTDAMNVKVLWVSTSETIGDVEANVYIDRYGIQVYDNPTGTLVQNSKMTSTDLWIKNIHSNGTIYANNLSITGKLDLSGATGNLVFTSNVTFLGQNNYFAHGLMSNGNIGIGVGINGFPSLVPLHIVNGGFPTSARQINSNSVMVFDTTTSNTLVEFRATDFAGVVNGLVFVDNDQSGYVVYNHIGGSSGNYGDTLRLGASQAINFEVGGQDTGDGVANKDVVMFVSNQGAGVNGFIRLFGSTSGYTELVANAVAGSASFTLPTVDGSNEQAMVTDGAGKLGWKTIPTIGALTDLQLNSLGVGTPASGVTGEIRATSDITAFYSSDRSLKTNIKNIDNALEKISQINGVSFDWTDDILLERGGEDDYFNRKHDVGVIAQEIEQVLPEVVGTRENGIKAVKYDRIVALLIEGIKELKAELDEVKKNGGCNCGCK